MVAFAADPSQTLKIIQKYDGSEPIIVIKTSKSTDDEEEDAESNDEYDEDETSTVSSKNEDNLQEEIPSEVLDLSRPPKKAKQQYHTSSYPRGANKLMRSTYPLSNVRGNANATPISFGGLSIERRTVLSCMKPLQKMCRLGNLPGILVMHTISIHLMNLALNQTTHNVFKTLMNVLLRPNMVLVLACLCLISSVSMVVNDYFDAQSGVDYWNEEAKYSKSRNTSQYRTNNMIVPESSKPLISGEVPIPVAEKFLTGMYAALAIGVWKVPGMSAKLAMSFSTLLTFLYTTHIKPLTWAKNISCAVIISLSPLVSGIQAVMGGGDVGTVIKVLWRLVGSIFAWSMTREIVMDLADYNGDKAVGVQTIPVRHGKRFASRSALAFTVFMSILCVFSPLLNMIQGGAVSMHLLPSWARLTLAGIASTSMLRKSWMVCQNEGDDGRLCEEAVEKSKMSFALILASFV
eukprot:CAMPEP_0195521012 /NCGR_PEP_ID=MMETSP0794_2-20130614/17783_1 /TAXON_ID=515487 /ORGANISM="Stephanopyxis turris, Strain CCMP 815" /LENGTH=461 /DNA_ID=CAMNT_0040650471 /DNA_START=219 /DNA_END=1605 /DNA_ORIENTATION=-